MTDEQIRRAESQKARDAFALRVDATLRELIPLAAGLNTAVARRVIEDALHREARVTARRVDRAENGR